MNKYIRYLSYDLTHSQPDGYGNKLYFKFDTVNREAGESEGTVLLSTSPYWHYLENLSYQPHTKLGGMQKFQRGHFFDQMTDCNYSCMWSAKG